MGIRQRLNSLYIYFLSLFTFLNPLRVFAATNADLQVDENTLEFQIPTLGEVLTFIIRFFFVMAGLAALLYLLLGAFTWITSGGNKENVDSMLDLCKKGPKHAVIRNTEEKEEKFQGFNDFKILNF